MVAFLKVAMFAQLPFSKAMHHDLRIPNTTAMWIGLILLASRWLWRIAMGSWWGLFWTDKIPGFLIFRHPHHPLDVWVFPSDFSGQNPSIHWIIGLISGGDACLHLADARAL
jgi:hypothetical protein